MLRHVLIFTAVVEAGTGFALLLVPALVVALLLGAELTGAGLVAGRCFGIALVALALACWPVADGAAGNARAYRAMLVYNALVAAYLAWLGSAGLFGGKLLWPAALLHAGVTLALAIAWKHGRLPTATAA